MTSVQEMKRHLSMYVKNDMFGGINIPPKTNKRHYRRIRAIHNHIFFERQKIEKVSDWPRSVTRKSGWMETRKSNQQYFRSKCSSSTGDNTDKNLEGEINVKRKSKSSQNSLLFVYQEPWQKRLLLRYGNELVLLDVTYRTTRYALKKASRKHCRYWNNGIPNLNLNILWRTIPLKKLAQLKQYSVRAICYWLAWFDFITGELYFL